MRVIAPELPFQIKFIEITEPEQVLEMNGYRLKAFRVNHNVICYGYTLEIDRAGKFDVERAEAAAIPKQYWGRLAEGRDGDGRRPRAVHRIWFSDRREKELSLPTVRIPDLQILSGRMQKGRICLSAKACTEKRIRQKKAREYKHMTFYEAAQLAKDASVKEMWLTHYSPSLNYPEEYMEDVRAIFPNAVAAKDRRTVELVFED